MLHHAPSRMHRADRARERAARFAPAVPAARMGTLGMNAPGGKHGAPGSDGEWDGVRTTRVPTDLPSTVQVARAHMSGALGAVASGSSESDAEWLAGYAQRVDRMRYDMAIRWAETVYDAQAFAALAADAGMSEGYPCAITLSWNRAVDSFVAVVENLYDALDRADESGGVHWSGAGKPDKAAFVSRVMNGLDGTEPIGWFAVPECGEAVPNMAPVALYEYVTDLPWAAPAAGAGAIAAIIPGGVVAIIAGAVVLIVGAVMGIGAAARWFNADDIAASEEGVAVAQAAARHADAAKAAQESYRAHLAAVVEENKWLAAAGRPTLPLPALPAPTPGPAAGGGGAAKNDDDSAFPGWVKPIIGTAAVAAGVMLIIAIARRNSEPARAVTV